MISFNFEYPDFEAMQEHVSLAAHRVAATEAVRRVLIPDIPGRFDGSLERALGYEKRDAKYQKVKVKIKKRSAAMNFSGRSRGIALRQLGDAVRVTKKFMGVQLRGMPLQYKRARRGARINLAKEIRRVSLTEARRMKAIYRANYVDYINSSPDAQKKRRERI